MNHAQLALDNFNGGYNCAQAVFLAFSDVTGMERGLATRLSASFGGGMGRLREVCGAVSAIFMVAGILYAPDSLTGNEDKSRHYARIQELAARFREEHGTILCRELLEGITSDTAPQAEARTPAYYKKRPCGQICADAAAILDDYIAAHPPARGIA